MKTYQIELISDDRSILQLRVAAKSKAESQVVALNRVKELGYNPEKYRVLKVVEIQ